MELISRDRSGIRILECVDPITRIEDALDLIVGCIENDSSRLLLESSTLPAAFFDLRSGFAGEFVQKFVNYQVRLAAVFPSEDGYSERFGEFLSEARRGRGFRAFVARHEAEDWLASE